MIILLFYKAYNFNKERRKCCNILLLFKEMHKIQNIDIRKTFTLKTRRRKSKKSGTSVDADIRLTPNVVDTLL